MSTFATCGTTTAKGLYENPVFVLHHYAFGSVNAPSIFRARALPLRPREVDQACSAAARVPPRCPSLGDPLLARLAVLWFLLRGDTSCRGSPPADLPSARSAFPSSLYSSSLPSSSIREEHGFQGRQMCFPVMRPSSSLAIACLIRPRP